jgi:arylsulfatase A-like enzyme
VILIVLDTVRAESLGLYGYGRDTTPQLAKLASRGVRFDRAFSTAPWTAPSHASLFTARWPHELTIGWDHPLDATYPTLAEDLGSRGYATAGFVANTTYCSYETGLARGFQHYEDYDVTFRGILLCSSVVERTFNFLHKHPELARLLGDDASSTGDRKDAARINRDFLGWLDGRSSKRPFFAFLNYYDAHHPYLSPEPETGPNFGRKAESARDFRLLKTWWERDKQGIKPDDLALARDSYDHCIAYLFDDLEKRGLIDDSIVIVTADHGEHLGERDLFGHGCSVYRPELHVPLILVAPGLLPEKRIMTEPVSLRDIPATVQDLTGFAANSVFPGRSLTGLLDGSESLSLVRSEVASPPEDDPNRGRSPASKGAMTSIVSRDYHYIKGGDGREELYDLNLDPAELHDLSRRAELAATLGHFRDQTRK